MPIKPVGIVITSFGVTQIRDGDSDKAPDGAAQSGAFGSAKDERPTPYWWTLAPSGILR